MEITFKTNGTLFNNNGQLNGWQISGRYLEYVNLFADRPFRLAIFGYSNKKNLTDETITDSSIGRKLITYANK